MNPPRARISLTVAATMLIAGAGSLLAAGPAAAARAAAPVPRSTLSAPLGPLVRTLNFLPGLAHATFLGPAPAGTRLTVGISLATRDPRAEQSLFNAEYSPTSPDYHRFLSPAQFAALFGAPAPDVRAVEGWLRSGGLAVQTSSPAGDYLTAVGTTAQVGRLMHTSFGAYRIGPYAFVANETGPAVPSGVDIDDVLGLNTLQQVYPETQQASWLPRSERATRPAGGAGTAAASSYVGELTPQDLWGVYNMPAADEGQGEISGIFGDGYFNTIPTDLRYFEAQEHLPKVPVEDIMTEGGPLSSYADNTGTIEWTLDSQALTGAAPKLSQLDLYFANAPLDANIAAAFHYWADQPAADHPATQMNASFGECEEDPTSPVVSNTPITNLAYGVGVGNQLQIAGDSALEQAAMEGRTLFAAAGDTGGSCPIVILPVIGAGNGVIQQPDNEAGYPASSAYATAVGGTVVTTNGTTAQGTKNVHRVSEVSWMFSGGGSSYTTPEPAYQKPVAAVDRYCPYPDGQPANPAAPVVCRGIPDIADMSGSGLTDGLYYGSNSYDMVYNYIDFGEGGTSLSSPLAVGMWSRIQAAAPRNADGSYNLGFANETIYPDAIASDGSYTANYPRDFYDITASDAPVGSLGDTTYQNGPGWDYASGFGALNVANFIRDVDHDPTFTPTHPAGQVAENPALTCDATMASPLGNASDPSISVVYPYTNDAGQDFTSASLTDSADGHSLVVTMSGPTLAPSSPGNPPDDSGGTEYFVLWRYGNAVYGAGATVSATGTVSYVTVQPNASYGFTTTHTLASGSFANGVLTTTVPLADVGSPPAGSTVDYPYGITVVPGAVFVSFAIDQAAAPEPGQALLIGRCVNSSHGPTLLAATGPGSSRSGSGAGSGSGSSGSSSATGSLAMTGASLVPEGGAAVLLIAAGVGIGYLRRRSG